MSNRPRSYILLSFGILLLLGYLFSQKKAPSFSSSSIVNPRYDPPRSKIYPNHIASVTSPVHFTHLIQPTVYCSTEERTSLGLDGGKWACHPRVLFADPERKCMVYSFGSNGQFGFEEEILKLAPNCEVHTFDPTPGLQERLKGKKVPPQIVTHFDYGLGAEGVRSSTVGTSTIGPLVTLDEVANQLGHDFIHYLKIDVEGSEKPRHFVNTSEHSIWRKAALLQLEIHPSGPDAGWLTLFDDLAAVGFELYHFEVNMIHPMLTELSFLNPKVMAKYLKIPYTQRQLLDARRDSLARVDRQLPPPNAHTLDSYALVEQSHFGCRLLKMIPGQISRSFCEPFVLESRSNQDLSATLFVFEDGLDWTPFEDQWLEEFAGAYNLKVHRWTANEAVVASSCPKGVICHALPNDNDSEKKLATLSWDATVKSEISGGNLSKEDETRLAMVLIRVGSSITSTLALLNEPSFLATMRALPKMQLVIDMDFCFGSNDNRPDMKALFQRLRKLEFHLLEKSLDVERSLRTNKVLTSRQACLVTLTFAR